MFVQIIQPFQKLPNQEGLEKCHDEVVSQIIFLLKYSS